MDIVSNKADILARNGDKVRVGDICVFITPRGTEVMKITEARDTCSVYAKGVTDSGSRWVCNILRKANADESRLLREILEKEAEFTKWYNQNIMRYGHKEDLRKVRG